MALWLAAHQPPDSLDPAVVHGDFKLDNVLLNPLEPADIVAVLDWEMAALGDPLIDLGILLAYWTSTESPGETDALTTVTGRPGYLHARRDRSIATQASRAATCRTSRSTKRLRCSRLRSSFSRSTTATAAVRPTTRGLRRLAPECGRWLIGRSCLPLARRRMFPFGRGSIPKLVPTGYAPGSCGIR